jgi:hypothetical protein
VEYGLSLFGRLLTVNGYFRDVAVAPDLEPGQLSVKDCANFRPFVAEFLSDDTERIRALRAGIREDEWRRATFLGRQYRERNGDRSRDGRPLRSFFPANGRPEESQDIKG